MRWRWWLALALVTVLTLVTGYCLLRASRPKPGAAGGPDIADGGVGPAPAR